MKTVFHSHFYANFHGSLTLLFLSWFTYNFHQNVELIEWEWSTPFREVFAHFLIGKGLIFCPKTGLGKSLMKIMRLSNLMQLLWHPKMLKLLSFAHIYLCIWNWKWLVFTSVTILVSMCFLPCAIYLQIILIKTIVKIILCKCNLKSSLDSFSESSTCIMTCTSVSLILLAYTNEHATMIRPRNLLLRLVPQPKRCGVNFRRQKQCIRGQWWVDEHAG